MTARFPLVFFFASGTVVGLLLIQQHPPSPPSKETSARSGGIPERTSGEKAGPSAAGTHDLIRQIRAALNTGELAEQDPVFTKLLLELIEKDPRAAAGLADSREAGPLREEMLRLVARHWTEQDPAGARQWAEQLPDPGERNAALTDICFQIAQTDPSQATQLADGYGLSEVPGVPLENLVQQWTAQDADAAAAWVEARPASEQKSRMFMRVAMIVAETSPAEAAQMVVDRIPEGGIQTEAAVSVVYQWAKRDLQGARAWVELFPEGPLRERALNELKGIEQYRQAGK